MKKEELEKIKLKERWPVKFSDFYNHYFFLIFPLAITVIGLTELTSGLKNDITNLKLMGTGIAFFGFSLLIIIIKRLIQNHRFERHFVECVSVDEIKNALKVVGFHNCKFYKKGYFECITKTSGFSWGEVITIIPESNYILVNSRPIRQPVTFFKDRRNIQRFLAELKNSTANKVQP